MNHRTLIQFPVALMFASQLVHAACGAPATEATEVDIRTDKPIRGVLSKAAIRKVVHKQLVPMAIVCIETYGERGSSGRVDLKFVIDNEGKVMRAEMVSSTLHNERVDDCVVDRAKLMVFPKYDGIGPVTVTYPFEMSLSE